MPIGVGFSPNGSETGTPPGDHGDETTRLTPMRRDTGGRGPTEQGVAEAIAGCSTSPPASPTRVPVDPSAMGQSPTNSGEGSTMEMPTPRAVAAEAILEKETWPAWNDATEEFRAVRSVFGIDNASYLDAFPTTEEVMGLEEGTYGSMNSLFKEIISDGASGSYFYFTRNKEYIVKSISEKEHGVLMKVAASYRNYVVSSQGRTLIHYYGAHSIQLPMQEAWCDMCCKGSDSRDPGVQEEVNFALYSHCNRTVIAL